MVLASDIPLVGPVCNADTCTQVFPNLRGSSTPIPTSAWCKMKHFIVFAPCYILAQSSIFEQDEMSASLLYKWETLV